MKWEIVQTPGVPGWIIATAGLVALFVLIGLAHTARRYSRLGGFRGTRPALRKRKSADVVPFRTGSSMADPQAQIEAVSQASFEKRRLMNSAEYRVFCALESLVSEVNGGFRVMAQTSLGELIQPSNKKSSRQINKDAFASINSKRLDFAIVDRSGFLALAVEYQGSGHYLGQKAFMRDAVKREALRRAGVDLMEVVADWDREELAIRVRNALIGSKAAVAGAGAQ